MKLKLAIAAFVAAIFSCASPAVAQPQPCQWQYTFDTTGAAVASFCGSVRAPGLVANVALGTIVGLQAISQTVPPTANETVDVSGYTVPGDGGGGEFVWTIGALCNGVTGGGDGGTTFCALAPSSGFITTGYWKRFFIGPMMALWWNNGVLDIGGMINAAYAALPASGGEIDIPVNPAGGSYNFTTPIVLSTLGKPVSLIGQGSSNTNATGTSYTGNVVLNYTPTTATSAITIDSTVQSNNLALNNRIGNFTLINNGCTTSNGCGSSAIGFNVGAVNGGDMGYQYNAVTVSGFGIAYQNEGPNGSGNNCCQNYLNMNLQDNGVAMNTNTEAARYMGGQIFGNGKVWEDTINNTKKAEIHWISTVIFANGTPFFDATTDTGVAPETLSFTDVHLENGVTANCHFFQGLLDVQMTGGVMEDDPSTGTCDFMIQSSLDHSYTTIFGTQISSARTVTTIIDATHLNLIDLYPVITSGNTFTNFVSGANASLANVCPIRTANSLTFTCNYGLGGANSTTYQGGITVLNDALAQKVQTTLQYSAAGTPLPTCNAGLQGSRASVTDATAPAFNANYVSGGAVKIGVYCNGSNWVTE